MSSLLFFVSKVVFEWIPLGGGAVFMLCLGWICRQSTFVFLQKRLGQVPILRPAFLFGRGDDLAQLSVSALDALCAFLCAVCSGMGVGGGAFYFLYLTLFCHWDTQPAQNINFLCFICASLASLLRRPKKSEGYRPLPKGQWLVLFLCGCGGVIGGRILFSRANGASFHRYFGIFLCLCALYGLFRREKPSHTQ